MLQCRKAEGPACAQNRKTALAQIAQHWADSIDAERAYQQGLVEMNGDEVDHWVSSDLLLSYTIRQGANVGDLGVTREACSLTSKELAPYPLTTPVSCASYSVEQSENEDITKLFLSEGDQAWRVSDGPNAAWRVLQSQMKRWNLEPGARLKLDQCQDDSLDEQDKQIFECNWRVPDGMGTFSVTLTRYRGGRRQPWSVFNVYGTACWAGSSSQGSSE